VAFRDIVGNRDVVRQLQESIAAERVPHAFLFAGPKGVGKYTLALAMAQTLNCLEPESSDGLPDACGRCHNCIRIAESLDLDARFHEAVEAREDLRDADRKDTRILIQTHPDVLIVPPDPPQMLVKVGQVRSVIHNVQRPPSEGRHKVYIFPASTFMNEAANALLKVLEEPPEYAHLLLLTENASALLPTIRSRASLVRLAPLPVAELIAILAERRPEWSAERRELAARLAEGAVGAALSFDADAYMASRRDALVLLHGAIEDPDPSALFHITETYRAGAEGQEKMRTLLHVLYLILQDLLWLQAGESANLRNIDVQPELRRIAENVSFDWIENAARRLVEAESGMRRNLLRSLSLDALAAQMQPSR
jgi:DNA polymerase-3 subunit delta'